MPNLTFTIPSVLNQGGGEKKIEITSTTLVDAFSNVSEKMGKEKKGLFGITRKTLPKPIKNLKELSQAIH